jgi:hypothetical protein
VTAFTDRVRKLGPLELNAPEPALSAGVPSGDVANKEPDFSHLKAVPEAGQFESRIPEFKIPDGA